MCLLLLQENCSLEYCTKKTKQQQREQGKEGGATSTFTQRLLDT